MEKENYFGSYKKSNTEQLNKYIQMLEKYNKKNYNFEYSFTKGEYNLKYMEYIETKKLNYKSLSPEQIFEELSDLYKCIPNWNNPGTMINIIPPTNLLTVATSAYTNLLNPNFAQDTYAGYLIASEFEVVKYMSDLMNWDYKKSRGIFTFGGKGTNLYATKIALKKSDYESSKQGCEVNKYFMITSKNAHPCHYQVCDWLGIGSDNCIEISCEENGQINIIEAENIICKNIEAGKKFLGYNLNGGSTNDLVIDPIKSIYDMNERICKKYHLDYKPHIHVDFVLGWVFLFFKNYHFIKNSNSTLKKIEKIKNQALEIKYADSVGIDFHKMGFAPYTSSLFMVKNEMDIQLLEGSNFRKIEDMSFGDYNPYNYTLELTRSSNGPLSALVSLKSLGIEGYQKIFIELLEIVEYLREKLSKNPKISILNRNSSGLATFLIIKPLEYNDLDISEILKLSEDEILKIKEYNVNFSKLILKDAKSNQINFVFTSSRSYKYPNTEIMLGALKLYPMSVFLNKNECDKICNNIFKEIIKYENNKVNYKSETYISDNFVYRERE